MRAEREKAVARRKDALTGTSEYPDLAETAVHVLDVTPKPRPPKPLRSRSRRCRASASPSRSSSCATPPTARWRRPARGRRCFSPISAGCADFTARATFAKNFFEAGGIEAVTNDGFADRDAMVAAFKASGAKLACLCSSDKVYAADAPMPRRRWQPRAPRISILQADPKLPRRCKQPVSAPSSLLVAMCQRCCKERTTSSALEDSSAMRTVPVTGRSDPNRRRRQIERQLRALRVMESHLTTKDIVWAVLTLPAATLLCLLAPPSCTGFPTRCRSPSAVCWQRASWCGGSGDTGSRSPGSSSLRWSASSWKTFRSSISATSATIRKRKKKSAGATSLKRPLPDVRLCYVQSTGDAP